MAGMITEIPNGCGACSGFWKWLKPPHKKFFIEECNRHDEAYNAGGTEADRKQADRALFFAMCMKSVEYYKDRKTVALWWFVTLALLYYWAVRLAGRPQYRYQ